MSGNGTHNTGKKSLALAAILNGRTMGEAADLANVSMRTMSRWAKDFKPVLDGQQADLLDRASRRLIYLADRAIDALEDNLNKDTPNYVRIKSATAILDYLLKLRGIVDVEARLAKLEALLSE